MAVHQEFQSRKFSLVFESGKIVELTKEELEEFEKWYIDKRKED